jgi:hypothetical protein
MLGREHTKGQAIDGVQGSNDRKHFAALASAKARGGCEAALVLNTTKGAANSGQLSPPFSPKPEGLLRRG